MTDKDLFLLPATLQRVYRKADRSVKLTFETNLEISPAEFAAMDAAHTLDGWLHFAPNKESAQVVPGEKAETGSKTPSQRLRGVLFVLWEQQGKEGDFEQYYKSKMEKLINIIKDKLV